MGRKVWAQQRRSNRRFSPGKAAGRCKVNRRSDSRPPTSTNPQSQIQNFEHCSIACALLRTTFENWRVGEVESGNRPSRKKIPV